MAKYKIQIKNFQSIRNLEFSPEGFTTFVGKSNRGKSAIVRALRVLFYNDWNSSFIRSGETECSVSMEFLDPKTVKKISVFKSKDRNDYEVEMVGGEIKRYPKIGKGVPDIFQQLNLEEIVSERGDSFNLNFSSQFDEVFMLGKGEAATSSFINKIFDIARWEKALKTMRSDEISLLGECEEKKQRKQECIVKKSDLSLKKEDLVLKIQSLKDLLSLVQSISSDIEDKKKGVLAFQSLNLIRQDILKQNLISGYLNQITVFLQEFKRVLNINQKSQEIVVLMKSFLSLKDLEGFYSLMKEPFGALSTLTEFLMKQKSRLYEITQLRLKRDKSDLINSLISDQSKSIESLSFNLGVLFQAKEIISLKKDLKNQGLYYDTIVEVGKNLEALKTDILKKTGKCPVCGKKTTRQKGDKHEEFCENA